MAFIRELGRELTDLKKPDGTPALPFAGQVSTVLQGSASSITGLVQSKATDAIKNGISTVIKNPNFIQAATTKSLPAVKKNDMEQFASYSVLWTLSCLEPHQFNNPKSYRNSTSDLKHIVFSSAGRFDSQRVKTFYGTPEYFVNNFVMTCIIGANEKTGNSNAIKFSFDIIEPYSMGLLLQSMQVAAVNAGYLNYLDNAPYVLRMDIQGYDENGQIIKSVKPKFFTLKVTKISFNVNEGGSTYKFEGIPYNHQGFSDVMNISYNDLKISGSSKSGTVAELLNDGENSLAAVLNRNEKKLVDEGKIGYPDQYEIQFPKTASTWYSSAGSPPKNDKATVNPLEILTKPVNGGVSPNKEQSLDNPKNVIGTASLGFDQLSGGNNLFKRANDQYDAKTGVIKRDNMTIDPKARAFQFGQGQSITSMINQVVLSSKWARETIDKVTPEGYIQWFKIDIQIELKEADPISGDYAKKITFRIVPYYIHQSIFSNPNSAPVGYTELLKQVCKEYQYIYTGQNVDVLKFDIQINNLFFTGTNSSPENETSKGANKDQEGVGARRQKTAETGKGVGGAAVQAAQAGRARPDRDPKLLKGWKGGSGDKTTEQNVAENFHNAFLSGNSADLVTVDLEILGDPYWLVDSGIANYFAEAPAENSQITNDGTMNYESGNVYIYLTFKTPADINETTGLYDFSVAGKESPFGGIYRIVQCENTFAEGSWKQKLKCLRMPGPQGPETTNKAAGKEKIPISKQNNGATTVGKEEAQATSPIQDTNKTTPVVPDAPPPATPAWALRRESQLLQEVSISKLDAFRANRTEENFRAYQEARAAADAFDRKNNLG